MHDVHLRPLEESVCGSQDKVAALSKDKRPWPLANHRIAGHNEYIVHAIGGHSQPQSAAGPKSPEHSGFVLLWVSVPLVGEG